MLFGLLVLLAQFAAAATGEIRATIVDASGAPVAARIGILSEATQVERTLDADALGHIIVRRLPFARYALRSTADGFAPSTLFVDVYSERPLTVTVQLLPAPVRADVTVYGEDTLVPARQAASVRFVGGERLGRRPGALPGRNLPDLISAQPGWLLEANGVLHPRGSEYQTQLVIDGLPQTENRSPAFAPEPGGESVHALRILTGGYPAEYGRKLGGVIEVITGSDARTGIHGQAAAFGGSFETRGIDGALTYGRQGVRASAFGNLAVTGRYLDPPVEENFTNRGQAGGASLRLDADLTTRDRFGLIGRVGRSAYQVPNEREQQEAGQRQDATGAETALLGSYDRLVGTRATLAARGMIRDVGATLRSNPASTPVAVRQNRSFGEGYLQAALSLTAGQHELKAGMDTASAGVREQFAYVLTEPGMFDDDAALAFGLDTSAPDREFAAFAQDTWQVGNWTVSGGMRWDRYAFLATDTAWSPRVAVAKAWPSSDLVVRASYDRVFQTPAIENLLLASSPATSAIGQEVMRLPVAASRGNFYEAGLSKGLSGVARVDVSQFERRMDNFADDDVLFNTGISFPIAFNRAVVRGTEVTVEVPRRGRVSMSASYSYLHGVGYLPVTGGLFLGDDVDLDARGSFPITQDQRHTASGRVVIDVARPVWVAFGVGYGSGLPVEVEGGDDLGDAVAQYGPRIVDRIDVEAERVRPRLSLDATVGLTLRGGTTRRLELQVDVRNLTNRLDVINFSGLFSGTALAPPRSAAVRLRASF